MTAVLIVDESRTVSEDLGAALEAAGFRTLACPGIAAARSALRTHAIALAIIAPELPDGDGLDLLEQLRRDNLLAPLPVLLLATWAEVMDRVRDLAVDYDDCVGKPYDRERVVARVRRWLGAPPPRELVLIIDADPAFRSALADALGRAGIAAIEASRGDDGLHQAETARPTAIVVDGGMLDIDGTSVVRRLRLEAGLRTTPCIVLGAPGAAAELRALDAGADGFIPRDDLEVIVARIAALLRAAAAPLPANPVLAPKRVLTVDDDGDYLELLGDRLRKRGYDVLATRSGEAALEVLAAQPDAQQVDCILLDRSMAGLGGIATCRRIKDARATRDIPLIILTATEQRDAVIEGLGAGADDFVSKASGFDVLSARVQAQLRRRQIEDEQRRVRDRLLHSELAAEAARAARELAETRGRHAEELAATNRELAATNRELEAFSYSVAHDLRAPLRTIGAFTAALGEDLEDRLDDRSRDHLRRVVAASTRMGELIDALLELSRISREPVARHRVDMSELAASVLADLSRRGGATRAEIAPDLIVAADGRLIRILLDNLLANACKLAHSQVALGRGDAGDDSFVLTYDGGALSGIGLATAQRVVERHGGALDVSAEVSDDPARGTRVAFSIPRAEGSETTSSVGR